MMDLDVVVNSRSDREILKRIITAGDYNVVPYEGSKCKLTITDVTCLVEDGASSNIEGKCVYLDENFDGYMTIGDCDYFIDKDIDLVVQSMCKGECSLARIVYKDEEDKVKRKYDFMIHLLEASVEDLVSDWDVDRLFTTALMHKDRGVELVKGKRIIDAFRRFSKALKLVIAIEPFENPVDEEKEAQIIELKVKIYNNLAHCQLHFNEYEAALQLCDAAIKHDMNNVKAYYRRCTSYMGLKMYEKAWEDAQTALKLNPNDVATQQKANQLKPIIQKINADYGQVIKKMFG